MVKLSSLRNKASKSHPPMAISPVKALPLPVQATEPTLAQKLKAFDPISHGGEAMAIPLVGAERFTQD
jgi:hypothetical protein